MSEFLLVNGSKDEIYRGLLPQVEAVISGTGDLIANLAIRDGDSEAGLQKISLGGFYWTTSPNLLTRPIRTIWS